MATTDDELVVYHSADEFEWYDNLDVDEEGGANGDGEYRSGDSDGIYSDVCEDGINDDGESDGDDGDGESDDGGSDDGGSDSDKDCDVMVIAEATVMAMVMMSARAQVVYQLE